MSPARPRQSAAPTSTNRIQRAEQRQLRDFFVYDIDFAALAPGASANGQIQIQADADFELQKLTQFSDLAGALETEATRVLPLVTIQITDTGTGRQMFNAPVPIPALFGDGRIPFILPTTKLFSRNASVAFVLANYADADTYNIRLQLIGAKIFTYG
jgi:hypothetical protein